MATHHNFKIKNGLEVGGTLIVNSSGQLQAVTAAGNLSFGDGIRLYLGNSNDLEIVHTGGNNLFQGFSGDMKFINFADDKDIIFQSDNGSGGTETYFLLDGSNAKTQFNRHLKIIDNMQIQVGTGPDFTMKHDGSHTYLINQTGNVFFQNTADDQDIVFQGDDGSGGVAVYFRTDGSQSKTVFERHIQLHDSQRAQFGNGGDFYLQHDGTDNHIISANGHINISNQADDSDIYFKSDNGSGGVTTYFFIDGSDSSTRFTVNPLKFNDNIELQIGSSADLKIYHDGSDSNLLNTTGNLVITNSTDDGDITFVSDNGSGGTAEYFRLDGGNTNMFASKTIQFADSAKASFGAAEDLRITHDGNNSTIDNYQGDLLIRQQVNDKDIIFQSDNGSGGTADYIRLDGDTGNLNLYHYGSLKFNTTATGINVTGNTVISGNLTVNGTTTTINTSSLDIEDKNITLNKGSGDTSGTADGAGITIQDAVDASTDATFNWNSTNDRWEISHTLNFQDGDPLTWGGNSIVQHTGSKTHIGDNSSASTLTLQSGKVGIGTTSPNSHLHLLDDNDNSAVLTTLGNTADRATIRIENDNNATGAYAALFLRASTADAKIAFRHTAQNRGDLIFILDSTGGTPVERMRLRDTGRLGLGTNDPKGKLHILNNEDNSSILTTLGTTVDESSIRIENTSTATGAHASLFLRAGTGDTRIAAVKKSSTANDVDMAFVLDDASASDSKERMRIVGESGDVGIGTTSPNAKLEVNENTSFSTIDTFGQFVIKSSSGTTGDLLNFGVDSADSLAFIQAVERGTNVIPLVLQRYGGRVGIGTDSPNRELEVSNSSSAPIIRISNESNTVAAGGDLGIIEFYSGDNSNSGDSVQASISVIQPTTDNVSGEFVFKTSNAVVSSGALTEKMRITKEGRVGILKSAPSTPLHVTGTIRSQMDGNNAKYINLFGGNSGNFIDSHGNALFLRPSATTSLATVIRTDGTVGIADTLDIDHDMNAAVPTSTNSNLFLRDTNAVAAENGGAIVFSGMYDGSNHLGQGPYIKGYKVNANSGDFGFGLKLGVRQSGSGGSNVAITIKDNSYVGIGTTNPQTGLQVVKDWVNDYGSINISSGQNVLGGLGLRANNVYKGGLIYRDGTAGAFWELTAYGNEPFLFKTNNAERMRISNDGKVGIGTTSPGTNLHVNSGAVRVGSSTFADYKANQIFATGAFNFVSNNNGTFSFANASSAAKVVVDMGTQPKIGIGETSIDANLHITHSNPNIKFEINGQGKWAMGMPAGQTYLAFDETNDALTTPTMVMTKTTKRVGIGTTSPTELLEVNGNIKADTLKVDNITFKDVDGSPTDEINLTTEFDGSNSTLSFEGSAGQLFSVTNDLSGTFFSVNDVSGIPSIEVVDDGTVKLARFSGDVGIGTGSPNEKLHIQDSHSSAGTAMTIQNSFGEAPKEIKFRYTDTVETARITAFGRNNTSNLPYLAFSVNATTSSTQSNNVSERMRITNTGNVGIGVTAPSSKLHINGKVIAQTDSGYYIHNTSNSFRVALHDDGTRTRLFADGNGSNPHMTFNGGNVGVGLLGTNHPTTRFHVQGSGATVTSLVECTDGNQASLDLKNSEGHFRLITDGGGFFFYDQTDSRQPFTINTFGNVLIGTTNTNSVGTQERNMILGNDVNDSEVAYVLNVMEGSNNRRAKFFLDDSDGTYGFDATASSGVPRFVIRSATSENFTVNQNGRVGIGVASASAPIHVKGAVQNASLQDYGIAVFENTNLEGLSIGYDADNNFTYLYSREFGVSSRGLHINGSIFVDNYGGAVGIGTTSPGGIKLNVNSGTSNRVAKFVSTDATAFIQIADSSTTATSHGYGATGNDLSIFANEAERMRIKSDGKIGIGTNNPGSLLTVEGDIAVGDNDEIKLGASADLKLYHDGSNSYIEESGTGGLIIKGGGTIAIRSPSDENMIHMTGNGAVKLYHDNAEKLATTSTGVTVTGLLSATTKSFDIPHPTKEGMRLRYGVLEGPENGVYVRGKSDGYIIKLPEVWKGLVHEDSITVQLTAIGKPQDLYVENIEDNTVYLGIHPGKPIGEYYYYIQAERKDVEKLEVEYGNPL